MYIDIKIHIFKKKTNKKHVSSLGHMCNLRKSKILMLVVMEKKKKETFNPILKIDIFI